VVISVQRFLVIANPAARAGSAARALPGLERSLAQLGLDFRLVRSERPGHAIELAAQGASEGFDVVVAAGGDGTANEVLNGLMQAKLAGQHTPALGIVGLGRGNDFGYSVGAPGSLHAACEALADGVRRTIDIGHVRGGLVPEGRYFGNCVGVGFDAIGTIEANKLPRMGGFITYLIAVVKTIFLYYRAPLTEIECDGQTVVQPALMVSVMNGRRLGGGFLMAPDGQPDDGLFDVCIAGQVSRLRMFALLPHFVRGTQDTQEAITTLQGSRIVITALGGSLPAQMDGEIICVDGDRLEIGLLPQQIEVVVGSPGLST